MKILVVSDTHGDFNTLKRAVLSHSTAEVIIHCGDGESQVQRIKESFPDKAVYNVRGNCDWNSSAPATEEITVEGKKIFVTHGHLYQAKLTLSLICAEARSRNADILCFGHTHIPTEEYRDGLYVLNPGSCSGCGATCGLIEITPGGILTSIAPVR